MRRALPVLLATALAFALWCGGAHAQTVTSQPTFLTANAATDLGNGPLEVRLTQGSAGLSTASGNGTGSTSGSSTTLTLSSGTPAVAPCVGCIISGNGITSGTTVAAFNGTTTITLSAAMTVPASTPLAWGAACPSIPQATFPVLAGTGGDTPFYTQARICAYAPGGAGAAALTFPIAAH